MEAEEFSLGLAEAQRTLQQKVWSKKWLAAVHFDLDSSTKSSYGISKVLRLP